jgi:hypothetical protein
MDAPERLFARASSFIPFETLVINLSGLQIDAQHLCRPISHRLKDRLPRRSLDHPVAYTIETSYAESAAILDAGS